MTAGYYRATVRFTLESPFLTAGLAAPAFGADLRQLTTPDGRAVLPAGLVRGVLRHALLVLEEGGVDVADALKTFGNQRRGAAAPEHAEDAGTIRFRDCVETRVEGAKGRAVHTRVAISADTGAAAKGALAVGETTHPVGARVTFEGEVAFPAPDQAAASALAATFDVAARQVAAIGAWKTAGFGRVLSAEVVEPRLLKSFAPTPTPAEGDAFLWRFTLDGPLLVDTDYPEGNVLRTAKRISGAALKGALARRLADAGLGGGDGIIEGDLGRALSTMIIGFADRADADPPQSLSALQRYDGKTAKPADATNAAFDDLHGQAKIAAFPPDWKGDDWASDDVRKSLELGEPPSEVRTRLAIDETTGAAERSALFSHQFVPEGPQNDRPMWTARVTWPEDAGDPPQAFQDLLGHMKSGVFAIGRLKAGTADEEVVAADDASPAVLDAARVALRLTSPHLMCRAADMADESALTAAVERYFAAADGGLWRLARCDAGALEGEAIYFAAQELRGDFQAARFKPFGDARIEPFVLMSAGSIFVLDRAEGADPAKARAVLEKWAREGLPDPQWDGVSLSFGTCPFLRANGYGAVEVKLPGACVETAS